MKRSVITDTDHKIMALWAAGKSGSEIGAAIGKTRSAVSGRISRLRRLHNAPIPARPPNGPRKPVDGIPSIPRPRLLPIKKPADGPSLGQRVPLVETTGCKYPTDEDRGRHLFCNQPTVPNRSWCADHYHVVFRRPD